MIKDLFYFLYWIYAKSDNIKNPSLHSFVDICVILGFNLATICFIVSYYLDIRLDTIGVNGGFWGLVLGIILMIINYFSWYSKRQFLISQYKQKPRKEKVRRSVFAILYIIATFLTFYFTAKAFLPWA